nr:hypothetical protein GCM10020092_053040 [Actinoplanes digitatis]
MADRSRLRDVMSAGKQAAATALFWISSSSRVRAADAGSGIAAKVSQTWVCAQSVGQGGAALPLLAVRPPQQSGSTGQSTGPHGAKPGVSAAVLARGPEASAGPGFGAALPKICQTVTPPTTTVTSRRATTTRRRAGRRPGAAAGRSTAGWPTAGRSTAGATTAEPDADAPNPPAPEPGVAYPAAPEPGVA